MEKTSLLMSRVTRAWTILRDTFYYVIKGDRCQSCFGELIILLTDCVCYVFFIMYIIYFDVIFEE